MRPSWHIARHALSGRRTRTILLVLAVGLAGSWAGQVPAVYLLLRCWRRSLPAVYVGVSVGYALLCVLLAFALGALNWDAVAAEAAERARPAQQPPAGHVQQQEQQEVHEEGEPDARRLSHQQ